MYFTLWAAKSVLFSRRFATVLITTWIAASIDDTCALCCDVCGPFHKDVSGINWQLVIHGADFLQPQGKYTLGSNLQSLSDGVRRGTSFL